MGRRPWGGKIKVGFCVCGVSVFGCNVLVVFFFLLFFSFLLMLKNGLLILEFEIYVSRFPARIYIVL